MEDMMNRAQYSDNQPFPNQYGQPYPGNYGQVYPNQYGQPNPQNLNQFNDGNQPLLPYPAHPLNQNYAQTLGNQPVNMNQIQANSQTFSSS